MSEISMGFLEKGCDGDDELVSKVLDAVEKGENFKTRDELTVEQWEKAVCKDSEKYGAGYVAVRVSEECKWLSKALRAAGISTLPPDFSNYRNFLKEPEIHLFKPSIINVPAFLNFVYDKEAERADCPDGLFGKLADGDLELCWSESDPFYHDEPGQYREMSSDDHFTHVDHFSLEGVSAQGDAFLHELRDDPEKEKELNEWLDSLRDSTNKALDRLYEPVLEAMCEAEFEGIPYEEYKKSDHKEDLNLLAKEHLDDDCLFFENGELACRDADAVRAIEEERGIRRTDENAQVKGRGLH